MLGEAGARRTVGRTYVSNTFGSVEIFEISACVVFPDTRDPRGHGGFRAQDRAERPATLDIDFLRGMGAGAAPIFVECQGASFSGQSSERPHRLGPIPPARTQRTSHTNRHGGSPGRTYPGFGNEIPQRSPQWASTEGGIPRTRISPPAPSLAENEACCPTSRGTHTIRCRGP